LEQLTELPSLTAVAVKYPLERLAVHSQHAGQHVRGLDPFSSSEGGFPAGLLSDLLRHVIRLTAGRLDPLRLGLEWMLADAQGGQHQGRAAVGAQQSQPALSLLIRRSGERHRRAGQTQHQPGGAVQRRPAHRSARGSLASRSAIAASTVGYRRNARSMPACLNTSSVAPATPPTASRWSSASFRRIATSTPIDVESMKLTSERSTTTRRCPVANDSAIAHFSIGAESRSSSPSAATTSVSGSTMRARTAHSAVGGADWALGTMVTSLSFNVGRRSPARA